MRPFARLDNWVDASGNVLQSNVLQSDDESRECAKAIRGSVRASKVCRVPYSMPESLAKTWLKFSGTQQLIIA